MLKVKSSIFIIATLIGYSVLASANKTTVLIKFLNKYKTLEAISERIDDLGQFGEPNSRISEIFSENISPILNRARSINSKIIQNGYQVDKEASNSILMFEATYKHYSELIKLMNKFLTQVEKIYALGG